MVHYKPMGVITWLFDRREEIYRGLILAKSERCSFNTLAIWLKQRIKMLVILVSFYYSISLCSRLFISNSVVPLDVSVNESDQVDYEVIFQGMNVSYGVVRCFSDFQFYYIFLICCSQHAWLQPVFIVKIIGSSYRWANWSWASSKFCLFVTVLVFIGNF